MEQLEVDAVGIGYGFLPNTELSYALGCEHSYDPVQAAFFARPDLNMQSSRAGLYLAGEITGIGGSLVALGQGHIAGWSAAASLGRVNQTVMEQNTARARQSLRYQQAFAGSLNRIF